jgi:hypothetical protein
VTAGAGDDSALRAARRGEMRASDADRELVIGTLKAAYVYGLVTKDEFDERIGHTLGSRTHADLALITADIPAGLTSAPATLSPARPKTKPPASANPGFGGRAVIVPTALAGLALALGVVAGGSVAGQVALGAAAECAVLSLLFLAVAQIVSSLHDKRSGGQLPPGGRAG